ncbi:MAG: response regulator [Pseudomonadales bacterium]|nr:response regulator [Pseudomonadales bacterium]
MDANKRAIKPSAAPARSAAPRSGWRLGSQITVLVAGSLLITLIAAAIGSSLLISSALSNDYLRSGKNIASVLARQARVYVLMGNTHGVQQSIDVVRLFPGIEKVAVYEADDRLLAHFGNMDDWTQLANTKHKNIKAARLELETDRFWQFVAPVFADSAEPALEDLEAVREQYSMIGLVRMRIGKSQLYEARDKIIFGNIAVIAFFSLILLFALRRLSAFLTRPLEEFVETMRAGAKGQRHSTRVNLSGSRETVQLSNSFNHMMQVLEEREAEIASTRDQALNAARLKSEFAANVSHEIRTPLNGIVGTLNLLSTSGLNHKQAEYVALAERASKSLVELINDILDFSRLTLDQSTLSITAFDLQSLMEELIALQSRSADAATLDLLMYYDPSLPALLESDPNKIRQLLNNFLSNAVKFTDTGTVELIAEKEVDSEGKVWVKIAVTDTGIGIDEKDQGKIFLPYAQSDGSMARKYTGTGLGLAISEKIAELLHGDIGVNSVRGEGSEFFVRIPFKYRVGAELPQLKQSHWPALQIYCAANDARVRRSLVNVCDRCGLPVQQLGGSIGLRDRFAANATFAANRDRRLRGETAPLPGVTLPRDVLVFGLSNSPAAGQGLAQLQQDLQRLLDDFPQLHLIVVGPAAKISLQEPRCSVVEPPFRSSQLAAELDSFFAPAGKPAAAPIMADHSHSVLRGCRVLLVEDNKTNQKITLTMLAQLGCETVLAENGPQALELHAAQNFDLVFMDCQLPGMSGFDVTRSIRTLAGRRAKVPIVAMTANFEQQDQMHCYEAGMNDFLSKPVTLADIVTVAEKWLAT